MDMVFSSLITKVMTDGDRNQQRLAWLIRAAMDEAFIEMEDKDTSTLEQALDGMGSLIRWIATGDITNMPEFLRPYLEIESGETLAIEAKESVDA